MIKTLGEELLQKFGPLFTTDFEKNKKVLEKICVIKSKKLRNVLAGWITHLVKKKLEKESQAS